MVKKTKVKKKRTPKPQPKADSTEYEEERIPKPPSEDEVIGDITKRQDDIVEELFWLFADALNNETKTPEEDKVLTDLLKRDFWVVRKAIYDRVLLFAEYFSLLHQYHKVNLVRSGCQNST